MLPSALLDLMTLDRLTTQTVTCELPVQAPVAVYVSQSYG